MHEIRISHSQRTSRLPSICVALCLSLPLWLAGCGRATEGAADSQPDLQTATVAAAATSNPAPAPNGAKTQTARTGVAASPPRRALAPTPQKDDASNQSEVHDDSAGRSQPDSLPRVDSGQPVFRRDDPPPQHDDAALAELGIRLYTSRHFRLYTDIDPETARTLPPFVDAAYKAWEAYFGKLPPAPGGGEFIITGYLMRDQSLFRETGLLTPDVPAFVNGRHRGTRFWMNEQPFDYYRRHLVIHEATHCFMETLAGPRYLEELPVWYWEGMAELFGTHRILHDGTIAFGVMPHNKAEFAGLGRIKIIQEAMQSGGFKTLEMVGHLKPNDYLQNDAYAWSWAVCQFLNSHPRYRDRFRRLAEYLTGRRFQIAFHEMFDRDYADLEAEWPLFVSHLEEGYDIERAAIEFRRGGPLNEETPATCEIDADRGWQSSGVLLEEGRRYEVVAEGRFTLANEPKPWVSEPQGVSFSYAGGRPLGELLGAIRIEEPLGQEQKANLLNVNPIGRGQTFAAPVTGTLYLRLNDDWHALSDNAGRVRVTIRALPPEK